MWCGNPFRLMWASYASLALRSTPQTLRSTPQTLRSTPQTLRSAPQTLRSTPHTPQKTLHVRDPKPYPPPGPPPHDVASSATCLPASYGRRCGRRSYCIAADEVPGGRAVPIVPLPRLPAVQHPEEACTAIVGPVGQGS
eukprot:gene17386-biopygen17328